MKYFKFILITTMLVIICGAIPYLLFVNLTNTTEFQVKVEGSNFDVPAGYLVKITANPDVPQDAKENLSNYTKLMQNINDYNNHARQKVIIYLFALESLMLIVFGILLLKLTDKKLLASSLITAGVISLIICIYLVFAFIKNVQFF